MIVLLSVVTGVTVILCIFKCSIISQTFLHFKRYQLLIPSGIKNEHTERCKVSKTTWRYVPLHSTKLLKCSSVGSLKTCCRTWENDRRTSWFSHTYVGDNILKQVLHYTLLYKTGHLKMDPNLWRRGGQKIGQAREESFPLTWDNEGNTSRKRKLRQGGREWRKRKGEQLKEKGCRQVKKDWCGDRKVHHVLPESHTDFVSSFSTSCCYCLTQTDSTSLSPSL